MGTNLKSKKLQLEDYDIYVEDPKTTNLTTDKLNQIIHMHGFFKFRRENLRKRNVLDALSEIEDFMNPQRSTLNENLSIYNRPLTVDQVNDDLDTLQWRDFPIESVQSLSFDRNVDENEGNFELQEMCVKKKRGRKKKVREVFDPVHLTKPRSKKNIQKKKKLSDICMSA
ncbi:hypothetical protein BVRB_3g054120 [Beta vulgaris subsp. vulgaris]|nr:hypothetical protein BVRB_3g054120 [Beta vulgaris subsp. vulgaris]